MRRKAISNIMFYVTTVLLILTIVFCIGSTVKSESSNETQRIENQVKEQQLLTKVKIACTEIAGFISGNTMLLKVLTSPEPSILAASTKERGRVLSMYCFI